MSREVVRFQLSGKYGHFRKPYSNVSALSYPIPPRTALVGLIGAILGIEKDEAPVLLGKGRMDVAVQTATPVTTVTHIAIFRQSGPGEVNTKKILGKREAKRQVKLKKPPDFSTPALIPMEILREPSYLVDVALQDLSLMDDLIFRLKHGRAVYTPCLGLSEFLAEIEYISEGTATAQEAGSHKVATVVPVDGGTLSLNDLDEISQLHVQEIRLPYLGTPDRRFTYRKYLVNFEPKPIPVTTTVPPFLYGDQSIMFM